MSAAGGPPGPGGVVAEATAPWAVVLLGAVVFVTGVFVTGASAPPAVDSPWVAVVVADPSVGVDAAGGVVWAEGASGSLRFGSTGAVALVTGASGCPAPGEFAG